MPRSPLAGARVVLGVSGGIAAYKAVELLRLLTAAGADVQVVMTEAATQFVGPLTFTALSGRTARTDLFGADDPIPHTRLGQWGDLVVVAPATANLLGRLAGGHADDLLTNVLLATRAPIVVACAMHTEMWEQPSVQRNLDTLRGDGVRCIEPEKGRLAGGDEGVGRMAEPPAILAVCEEVVAASGPGPHGQDTERLHGRRVLVTAGGTREAIDPVRYVGNRSTGKMGHLVAVEAHRRGADVTLVTTRPEDAPRGVEVVAVESAREMEIETLSRFEDVDCVVMAAAVADFRPAAPATEKLKKHTGPPAIVLEPTTDILVEMGKRKTHQLLVGFAAETENVAETGCAKLAAKNLDLLVANLVGVEDSGFGTDTNTAWLCRPGEPPEDLGKTTKAALAATICDALTARLRG
ncbi:MAG: bifunctional phosphopantothenoylcysteine decarboxylase/phosphopantothenate--cysteine ligase CoaBC [Acidimicrobiia bacterium]|nr:bifunctional phosphopantothenoylcysteine decarboxylase/phosphopantothenate--cysteine ligase CoaBC [Acidimicrobiia bacterium]